VATRTGYVGTESSGDTLTTTNFNKLPNGWIGDVSVTSDQGSITSEVDATSLTLTVTAGASRRMKIEGFVRVESTVAGDRVGVRIYKASTQIQVGTVACTVANNTESVYVVITDTPSTGSNTYKLTVARLTGSGTITLKASSTGPGQIVVTDIGPAS
jgi:hypothetical protein